MAFDRAGARAAGYSDKEIDAYLDQKSAAAQPKAPDWREQSLSALPGAFAAGGSILGGVLGTPGGPPGVAGGMLLGAGGGGYSGRVIEQYARSLMGLPPAQAEIMGQPIPQGMDLPATALGYASGEAAGMGAVSGVAGAARGMASMPPQVTKAVGKFAAGRIPGLRELTDLADLGRSLKGAVAPAEKAAETVKPKLAGRIRPGTPPTAEVATPQKPLAAEPGKAAREAAVRQRTIARPQRGASGPELARRAKMFAKTAAEPVPEDMTGTLEKSLYLEQEMRRLGMTGEQKAMARQVFARDPSSAPGPIVEPAAPAPTTPRAKAPRTPKVAAPAKEAAGNPGMDAETTAHFHSWLEAVVPEAQRFDVWNSVRDLVAQHPDLIGKRSWSELRNLAERNASMGLGASLFGQLNKPPPDSVRINEHWRRRPGRKETR